MASFSMNIPHQLSQQEALTRIKQLLTNLQQEHQHMLSNVAEHWSGDCGKFSFRTKGYELGGLITVSESQVNIAAELPFAVALFKGKIKNLIEQKARQILC